MSNFKIEDELIDVKKHCADQVEGSELVACLPVIVRVSITYVTRLFFRNHF